MYAFDTAIHNGRLLEVPRDSRFTVNIQQVADLVRAEMPKVLFLANPNNPDGGMIPDEELRKLLNLPLLVVVDEAYIDFAPPGSSLLNRPFLAAESENLVILRTFSKWAGLAGLRVGFGLFPEWMMPALWRAKQPYNVSAAASAAAIASLQEADILDANAQKIILERQRLVKQLRAFPWLEVYPSQANFLLCKVSGQDAAELKDRLALQGILLRHFNKPGLQDHIRISIGRPQDSARLVEALHALSLGDARSRWETSERKKER
jgi:histidinol-phosphate aminotransferase